MYFYQKMIYYKLKKVISSKYNRKTEQRYQRAVVFVIENIATGTEAFFQIDRIHKESASLRCNTRKCGHRLVIEHKLPTQKRSDKNIFLDLFSKLVSSYSLE